MDTNPDFQTIVVVGIGLIGGSLAKCLKQSGRVARVVGVGRNQRNLERAVEMGVIDSWDLDLANAAKNAEIVVVAVPVLSTGDMFGQIQLHENPGLIITDVGSAKVSVLDAAKDAFGEVPERFVAAHPVAGSERSGLDAVNQELFDRHLVIITPLENTDQHALAKVREMWNITGAQVAEMDAKHHDDVLAATSHLPHLLAFSLVDTLARQESEVEIFEFAAGGFRDFTRIASSDPVMWRDIFIANRDAVLESLDSFVGDLSELREFLSRGDAESMLATFTRAKAARDKFSEILEGRIDKQTEQTAFIALGGEPIHGELRVPGDKSISHRSIMLGSLAEGITQVRGFLEGEDSLATVAAFRDLGVEIEGPDQGEVTIHGVGLHGLKPAKSELYMGNSGTSMRLLSGLLCSQNFDSTLTGDTSLTGRPMERVAAPLRELGAVIETREGKPPLHIYGNQALHGADITMTLASAQVKSALLLAGLYAQGEVSVIEPQPTRDHTENMLRGFGYQVSVESLGGGRSKIALRGGGSLKGAKIEVPADISSAAFFMVAASIKKGSDVLLKHVGINKTRTGVIEILKRMGANIQVLEERAVGGESVADIRIQYAPLKGIAIPEELVPLAIDEFPVIFVAAACATGTTILTGAEELRVKESDRIQVMADGLASLGVVLQPTDDGIRIEGGCTISGGTVDSHGDHRIAMSFAVASLQAEGAIHILNCDNVATSFPGFCELARRAGLIVEVQ